MINVNTGNADGLVRTIFFAALVLFVWYWVIRLAVRHALTDVGLRRPVLKPDGDEPPPRPWATDPDEGA